MIVSDQQWKKRGIGDSSANSSKNFLPRTCCAKHKKLNRQKPGQFKENFRCTEIICLCSKTNCCYDSQSNKFKFSSKSLNKRTLEDSGGGPVSNYRQVSEKGINVTSTNRGFSTEKHAGVTYD